MGDVCYHEIIEGLFIGSLRSLGQISLLGITHVLSAVNFEVTSNLGNSKHLQIPLVDSEGDGLLPYLPTALAFIQEGMLEPGGRVLVHCQAGRSRSVAILLAYLMWSKSMTAEQALQKVKAIHSLAEPNEGYWAQLLLFQDMRCRLDEDHPVYRLWKLDQVGRKWEEEGWVDGGTFASTLTDAEAHQSKKILYRCRKCRTALCTERNLVPVAAANGHRLFRGFWKALRNKGVAPADSPPAPPQLLLFSAPDKSASLHAEAIATGQKVSEAVGDASLLKQTSIFVEPIVWMGPMVMGEVCGKLYCPGDNCSNRLGSFNWSGISNEQGKWVTPAFQLHVSKMDIIIPTTRGMQPAHGRNLVSASSTSTHNDPCIIAESSISSTEECVIEPVSSSAEKHSHESNLLNPQLSSSSSAYVVPTSQERRSCTPASDLGNTKAAADGAAAHALMAHEHYQASTAVDPNRVCNTALGLKLLPSAEHVHTDDLRWTQLAFSGLVFDVDGVLVDSECYSCEALRLAILMVTGVEIPHSFPQDFYPVFGMDVRSCIQYYKEVCSRTDWVHITDIVLKVSLAKEGIYKELTAKGIQAFDCAKDLISLVRELGWGIALASSGTPEKIRWNLKQSGLRELLSDDHFIVSTTEVAKGKPAPDVFSEAIKRLGCTDPSKVIVVEDTVNGLIGARAAGALTIAVTTSFSQEHLKAHADKVVNSLSDVMLLFNKLKKDRSVGASLAL
ncbi:hypothetical protein CEUSTIGMA_g11984.t1 [Chlamydomonas eustigma]|uniref:protein-tyrosine-phosphatase n=1 Tax=Chlamydomonas eustigma TaxID=1157962 RepID=A0A250XNJ8_9CHLO|nr:hypothetical protein CEUSTIGMA_g11984.t1 [Chlamydomonas eustigma]|eukprot:GAX84563.1 hypothetical protein CEUSTIGMA_g11984.t1 [Chlamydomonas eustigma]